MLLENDLALVFDAVLRQRLKSLEEHKVPSKSLTILLLGEIPCLIPEAVFG